MIGPIRRRLLLSTVLVALVAVLATAIAALTLVRTSDTDAVRDQLATQADRLAGASAPARESAVDGLSQLGGTGILVAVIPATGEPSGSAAVAVAPRLSAALRAGRSVSTTVRRPHAQYLVEGRPTADGGGVITAQDVTTARPFSPAALSRLLLALGIGFAVALLVAVLLARALARPLTSLAGAARRLAAGERGVPLEASRIDEVRDVEHALAALDDALAQSEGRQREFLLSISHELRTPLTAVRGYAEALRDGLVPPDRIREVGATLTAESARLAAFTDDLLLLARLEAEDFPVQAGEVDLADVLHEAASAWRAAADALGVALDVRADADTTARTDASRIRQVVDGLLENALRVSPAGGRIRLSAAREDGSIAVEVVDEGPGLTAEDAAHAFERGRLRDRYRDVRPVGTGLGLSIAAGLVQRLGGSITAHPTAVGARFRIVLPADMPSADTSPRATTAVFRPV